MQQLTSHNLTLRENLTVALICGAVITPIAYAFLSMIAWMAAH